MREEEYSVLLKELEELESMWIDKENISKIDFLKLYIKYWLFNRSVNRLRKRNK